MYFYMLEVYADFYSLWASCSVTGNFFPFIYMLVSDYKHITTHDFISKQWFSLWLILKPHSCFHSHKI